LWLLHGNERLKIPATQRLGTQSKNSSLHINTRKEALMSMFTHLATLQDKHTKLEGMLSSEALRPLPDFSMIQTLKKQKLMLKEEMERIRRTYGAQDEGDVA
jgi:hypothetical protein